MIPSEKRTVEEREEMLMESRVSRTCGDICPVKLQPRLPYTSERFYSKKQQKKLNSEFNTEKQCY